MKGFDQRYWREQYAEPATIDGIGNVRDHSRYVSAFFNLEGVEVRSLIDLGFGLGHLLREMRRTFKPRLVHGIEPSEYAFKKLRLPGARLWQQDLLDWARDEKKERIYDLALCNSVLQYLSEKELKEVLPVLARRSRFLYLTVPTDVEYQRQKCELDFVDPWAKVRTREQYLKLLRPHFSFLSTRILESKVHFNEQTTPFQDLLFRF